jgi:hypothetical protein
MRNPPAVRCPGRATSIASRSRRWCLALALLGSLGSSGRAAGAPMLGFVERFPGTSTQGWSSLQMDFSNPGTGGVGGNGDGFLQMSRASSGHFGGVARGPEYVGDWQAAGITQIRLWLNDLGNNQAFEVHVSVGYNDNLWQYDAGFIPPEGAWGQFTVDLSNASGFTHLRDTFGRDFEDALRNANLLHVRHDNAPFVQLPDSISGELALDHILLTDGVVGVDTREPAPRPVALSPPVPNPSRGPVVVTAIAPDQTPLELQVVDAQGRMVRRALLPGAGGPRMWIWDGRDGSGRPAPAGCYRVRALGRGGGTSRSLVRVR